MTVDRDEVNRVIEQLRTLHRRAAAKTARDYAARMLPAAARYNTPADLAALGTLWIGLYYAAAMRTTENNGVATLSSALDQRYRAICDGVPVEQVLRPSLDYPEEMERHLHVIAQLPSLVVISGMEAVRALVVPMLP